MSGTDARTAPPRDDPLDLAIATAVDVMTATVVTVQDSEGLVMAGYLMREGRLHHLPVHRGDALVGMLDDRALTAALSAMGWPDLHRPVSTVMRPVAHVPDRTPLPEVAHAVRTHGAVAVVDARGRLVGVVTASDLLAALARAARGGAPPGVAGTGAGQDGGRTAPAAAADRERA